MIEQITAELKRILPPQIRKDVVSAIKRLPDDGSNNTLYRANGVILKMVRPECYAEELKEYLCWKFTVPVPRATVLASIMPENNKPLELATGPEPEALEEEQ